MTVCWYCGHERHYHFNVDEEGHEEETRCAYHYGSGKWRCNCTGYEVEAYA